VIPKGFWAFSDSSIQISLPSSQANALPLWPGDHAAILAKLNASPLLRITESFDEGGFEAVNIEHFRSDGEGDGPRPGGSGRMAFFLRCVGNATISEPYASIVKSRQLIRELIMRALIVCAIVITAAVGLGGCFHHAQAVTQQPLKLG
jgi:hypothetical protein